MGKQPYRVLQIVTSMDKGGAETMIMNHYRALDRNIVQFDFLVHRQHKGAYDEEILNMGGRIFHAPAIRPWSYLKYFGWLKEFFDEYGTEFIAVHGHIQENSGFALKYAKLCGIKHRIASSHIANLGFDYKYPFRKFGKIWTHKYANVYLGCGPEAGRYLFGNRKFDIFNNAIDSKLFTFNNSVRLKKRKELSISDDCFVLGSVARFCPQKNHEFMIKIFKEILKLNPNSILLLIGAGPLHDPIVSKAKELGIASQIRFLGLRSDINEVLQAFDVFLMPSLFEGLPVSLIEAQAAGLPIVLSDSIDKSTDITGLLDFVSLKEPADKWAIHALHHKGQERIDTNSSIVKAGYDVNQNTSILLSMYGIN